MNRYTERDEFGNADIKGIDSQELYGELEFSETNKLTNALNRLADFEDLCEEINVHSPAGLKGLLGFIRFSDGYDEENQKEVHKIEFIPYADEFKKINKQYIKAKKNWQELKKFIESEIKKDLRVDGKKAEYFVIAENCILDKMEEIEEKGNKNETI